MMLPRLKNKTMNLLLSFVKLMGGCAERMTNMFKVVYEAAIRERQIKKKRKKDTKQKWASQQKKN